MNELTGQEKARFLTALQGAFSTGDMIRLIGEFFDPESFLAIAPPSHGIQYGDQLFQVIDHFNKQDLLPDLVAAARKRRPRNVNIAEIAETLGLTISGVRFDAAPQLGQAKPLEKIIQQHAKFISPTAFRETLGPLEGQVCWIAVPGGGGTGFLVGSDLVLTNYHVVEKVKANPVLASKVVFRFDFKQMSNGAPVLQSQITQCGLASDDWWIDGKPPGDKDMNAALGDATLDELDYALLRINSRIGDFPVGGETGDEQKTPRGWINMTTLGVEPQVGQQIFLLQHPDGEPLRLSVGTITEYNNNKSRVRYNANSKNGSSGSPCFNADLQLVALHHAHDTQMPPRWNQAIPIAAIVDRWKYPQN